VVGAAGVEGAGATGLAAKHVSVVWEKAASATARRKKFFVETIMKGWGKGIAVIDESEREMRRGRVPFGKTLADATGVNAANVAADLCACPCRAAIKAGREACHYGAVCEINSVGSTNDQLRKTVLHVR
jgi:hypothetical protein